jgi:hypothetical protein
VEPYLIVSESLIPVLEELMRLEPLFHAGASNATPQQFEELVAPGFWEVGASGRRYSREFALNVLREREPASTEEEWEASGYHVFEVAPANYLLTYTLRQPGRSTRRATLWRREGGKWKAIYHQGTVVQEVP